MSVRSKTQSRKAPLDDAHLADGRRPQGNPCLASGARDKSRANAKRGGLAAQQMSLRPRNTNGHAKGPTRRSAPHSNRDSCNSRDSCDMIDPASREFLASRQACAQRHRPAAPRADAPPCPSVHLSAPHEWPGRKLSLATPPQGLPRTPRAPLTPQLHASRARIASEPRACTLRPAPC